MEGSLNIHLFVPTWIPDIPPLKSLITLIRTGVDKWADLDQKVKVPSEENDKIKAHKLPVVCDQFLPTGTNRQSIRAACRMQETFQPFIDWIDEVIRHLCRILKHFQPPPSFYSHARVTLDLHCTDPGPR